LSFYVVASAADEVVAIVKHRSVSVVAVLEFSCCCGCLKLTPLLLRFLLQAILHTLSVTRRSGMNSTILFSRWRRMHRTVLHSHLIFFLAIPNYEAETGSP
jgi:hypothetical protein